MAHPIIKSQSRYDAFCKCILIPFLLDQKLYSTLIGYRDISRFLNEENGSSNSIESVFSM